MTALLASACEGTAAAPDRPPSTVTFEDQEEMSASTLFVSVADTPNEHRKGLMDVESLPADEGMAFVFDEPTDTTFWMKDTLIPLSIAFWDQDGRIVSIMDMEPCLADPCPTYGPDAPYVGAVEVTQGELERQGVGVGDTVDLTRDA